VAYMEMNLENLSKVDGGRIAAMFARHLQRAIADCEDRPGDKAKRTVTIKAHATPIMLQDGAATDVNIEFEVSSSVPNHISRPINCLVKHGGRALFNELAPDDVDQQTLDKLGDLG
jgi:hypothetical protein